MVKVSSSLFLDDSEIQVVYIRSSGPGGQNINKLSTCAQLSFNIRQSRLLDDETKERLIRLAGSRVTVEGVLIIEARHFRTREQNRLDAIQRLAMWIQKALVKPKTRKPTRPGAAAKMIRLDAKRKRGAIKQARRFKPDDLE